MADKYTEITLDSAVYTNTANWIGGAAPTANDNVFFQYNASQSLDGSDQSATELDDISILASCTGNAGSADAYLQLDQGTANKTIFNGRGVWYLDLGTSGSAEVRVDQTAAATSGNSALYLKNDTNAITLCSINSGNVRLVNVNYTTLIVRQGATVFIDSDSTIATIHNEGGTIVDYGASVTTWNQKLGTTTKKGADACTVNMYGGLFNNDGTGDITANMYGGTLDSSRDDRAKNVTATINGGELVVGSSVTLTETLNTITRITA